MPVVVVTKPIPYAEIALVILAVAVVILIVLWAGGYLSLFEKWEDREVTPNEWKQIREIRPKDAKFVMNLSTGNILIKIRPQKPPKPSRSEKMSEAAPPKEVKLKAQLQVKFMRLKHIVDQYGVPVLGTDGKQVVKGVTLSTAKIARKSKFITRKTGLKQLPFAMHFVDHAMLDKYDTLTFDEDWSEPINPETGEPEWSDELEELITQGGHTQMIEVATRFWKFILTRQHLLFMALGAFAGLFVVLGLAAVLHAFGGVQVNWQTHTPAGH